MNKKISRKSNGDIVLYETDLLNSKLIILKIETTPEMAYVYRKNRSEWNTTVQFMFVYNATGDLILWNHTVFC